ncbi:long-chain-fatty-acid--CoA ligase [Corynebacterium heidelbergense]|uniref:Long-chain fatty acid--CoA ligase n=1 Tax=Corynebacterium heidelbergense TaxID=2055947 RepID=A0A364V9W8_9CORY|nr:long-chain-fatty-acid--CoA ligase [Corynebacterium heidelbergense]RAV33435.1 long-chain fatty acid--CoA ligase [Corynebacterium heidelbergense]WCZ37605.1 Long-chain-fatty-acid--CoA ligase [Corynebacterium heidelbergense]
MNADQSANTPALERKAWLQFYTPNTQPQLDYPKGTLAEMFAEATRKFADRPALWFLGTSLTYSQFGDQVAKLAQVLDSAGVRPGDRVAVVLPNCPQNLISFYAIVSMGATAVYHNPLYTARELEGPFKDHGARVGIFWDNATDVATHLKTHTPLDTVLTVDMTTALPRLKRLALKLPLPPIRATRKKLSSSSRKFASFDRAVRRASLRKGRRVVEKASHRVTPDSTALILYTSGTTGEPKGAELMHRNLIANIEMGLAWVDGLGTGESPERMLAALPTFHAYGMAFGGALAPAIGGELLLLPSPEPSLLMSVFKKRKPTWVPGVPTLYRLIMEHASKTGVDISGVRYSFSGAASLPPAIVDEWERMTGGLLVEGYGLTETSPIVLGNPMSEDRRPGYVGIPFPDTEAKIVDPERPEVARPDGEAGELLVRGPQVFKGYLNKPDATRSSFTGDWFHTGDMAVMEPDGFVRIVSRIKEMIITGGFNVYPQEVEEIIAEFDGVQRVAVVGLPRDDGSETVVAAVVLTGKNKLSDATKTALKEHCQRNLTKYKVPREFYQLDELACDMMGKVRRTEVRQQVQELLND